MGIRYYYLLLSLFLFPTVYALLVPHNTTYELDWLERKDICLTAYTKRPVDLNVVCGGEFVASQPVPAGTPVTLCFTILGDRSKTCVFNMGGEKAYVLVRVVPRTVTSAVLALLLVVLIVRFTVKLTRIYIKSR